MNTSPVEKGDKVPAFKLPTDDGDTVSPADLAGSPAVIYFYPKDDTPGCTTEAKDFTRLAREFRKAGVAVVGISPDSVKKHQKFREKHELDVRLAADEDHSVAEKFGVWIEKSMYGRKYMGVDRATFLIDAKGRIAEAWRKVKVPGHAEEVLEAARRLSKG
ncbi:thioredoxin-dependent thiol peroxidase [Hyphomicrobium sp. CS1BSMeth3]|uniref:thioredoxin-dependent thiol peroxidase n=1 Tax=Hyphomicrobium sp. CS1BSMeth3 TaxID=1892844 RepID=UPI00092FE9FE|nr:thioredoxin-dependent thiol peroxidase [Hyphomicrobium sp. CS1BSMeth3]